MQIFIAVKPEQLPKKKTNTQAGSPGKKSWYPWYDELPLLYRVLLIIVAAGILTVTIILVNKAARYERLHLNFLPVLLGFVFEYYRVTRSWKTVIYTLLGAWLGSFLALRTAGKGQAGPISHPKQPWTVQHSTSWPMPNFTS